jgi:hypothetical protein
MQNLVWLIIQGQAPHEKSSGNCKDDIKTNARNTVSQEQG